MAAERYEISLLVFKNISLARCAHTCMEYSSTLDEKFRISQRPNKRCMTFADRRPQTKCDTPVKSNVEREINICPYLGVRNTPYLGNDVTVLHLLLVVEAG